MPLHPRRAKRLAEPSPRAALLACAASALWACSACSNSDHAPVEPYQSVSDAGPAAPGAADGSRPPVIPDAGTKVPTRDAGLPEGSLPDPRCAAFPEGPCGDGVLNCGEACDGTTFFLDTCAAYGFTSGELACTSTCTIDTSGCKGTEICGDFTDNDGNGLVDCADPACKAKCGDSCDQVVPLADPGNASGSTSGHPLSRDPSCAHPTGPEIVYAVTAAVTGTMTATLSSAGFLGMSFRRVCTDVTTELACGLGPISASVTIGDVVYLVVEPFDAQGFGGFDLHVETKP